MNYVKIITMTMFFVFFVPHITAITQEQQDIYKADPSIVKSGMDRLTPEARAICIKDLKNGIFRAKVASVMSGLLSVGLLMRAPFGQSTHSKVFYAIGSGLCSLFAYLSYWAASMCAQQAHGFESLSDEGVMHDGDKQDSLLHSVKDGMYIFSTESCPPCKRLHADIPTIQAQLPQDIAVFEYMMSDPEARTLIKRMGVTMRSAPLTVLVKNGRIIRIIVGYHSVDAFIEEIVGVWNAHECNVDGK